MGPVISKGFDLNGYLVVTLLEDSITDEKTLSSIHSILEQEAIKCGIEDVPVVFVYDKLPELHVSRSDFIRPVVGGLHIERAGSVSSTLTAPAKTSSGSTVALMSGHAAYDAGIGGAISQPDSLILYQQIGQVSKIGGTYADAAYVSYANIDEKVYTSSTQSNWESIVAWRSPWTNGTSISKSGSASGVTSDVIVGFDDSVSNGYFVLKDQWYGLYNAGPGDSGSPVYHMNNGHLELMGIHWGGSIYDYFSPVSGIMTDLDVVPALETTHPKGDFDYDNDVDFDDFVEFAAVYNKPFYYNSNGDFDDDGDVDFDDFVEFAEVYED